MSVKLMAMVFDIPLKHLSAPAKAVLLAMADNAWDDGTSCFPSQGLLAHKTNLSKRTVGRALTELKRDYIQPVGRTNMNVVEYKLDIYNIAQSQCPYVPERPYDLDTETTTPSQSDQEPISEPSVEPTYVENDADGVPKEHIMVWHNILAMWREGMPTKSLPRESNTKLQRKVKARMKQMRFVEGIQVAIEVASQNPELVKDSWFQLEYLLRNDDNWRKVANHEFDWKITGDAPGSPRVADPVTTERKRTENFRPAPGSV